MKENKMSKKVCMLLCYLPFLDARIFKNEVKSLLKKGYDITMIVPRKNGYLYNIDGKPFTETFLKPTFLYQGVKVVTYDDSKRTSNPLTDPLYRLGLIEEADIYHAHELSSFYYGSEIKKSLREQKRKNVKLVYDSRQLVPDPFSTKINDKTKTAWYTMLLNSIKEVDYIITVSESIKSWYLSLDPSLPVEIIYNSPPLSSKFNQKGNHDNRFVVCHEGNLSKTTGDINKIFSITDSCRKIMDFQFKIIGGPRYGETIDTPQHLQTNMMFTNWVDYYSLSDVMLDVDVGWIDLEVTHSLNNMYAMPNKFFSYLNNGIPILVNKCSDMEKFIRTYHCGLVIDKVNPTANDYTEALIYLYNHKEELQQMSINARRIMENFYSWEKMEDRLFNVYDSLDSKTTKYLTV
ncbi:MULTISPECIES: glycosyltransferase [Priestia]|uniref:glycosyltransferase n=1 Tax=Priestia TaxID=2800373 RepID=UPI0027961BAE|nr:glycosyltransferase [Priestia megaterium]